MNDRPQWTELLQSPARVPGWPIKACAGLLCVGGLALALPLGLLGLGLLAYIWLILRVRVAPAGDQDNTGLSAADPAAVFAPVDGRVVHIDTGSDNRCRIFLAFMMNIDLLTTVDHVVICDNETVIGHGKTAARRG